MSFFPQGYKPTFVSFEHKTGLFVNFQELIECFLSGIRTFDGAYQDTHNLRRSLKQFVTRIDNTDVVSLSSIIHFSYHNRRKSCLLFQAQYLEEVVQQPETPDELGDGASDIDRLAEVKVIFENCNYPYPDDDSTSSDDFNDSLSSIEPEEEDDLLTKLDTNPTEDHNHSHDRHECSKRSCHDDEHTQEDTAKAFGFSRFVPPPFLYRNTPPWLGRDDDINKIKEVCKDVELMTDACNDYSIWAVDQKIAASHIKLERAEPTFKRQIREVPVLHLTKQKIVNVTSGYKKAGLLEILRYMINNEKNDDITKLVSTENIRTATRWMKRAALTFCICFQVHFIQELDDDDREAILLDIQDNMPDEVAEKWDAVFQKYLEDGSNKNATFRLHVEMMRHCLEVVAISFAERIGGKDGYHLLRAVMKLSLLFAYTNGASQYAAFTTRLLADHCSAPPLIQEIKKDYFSLPYHGSTVNYGLDTIREEDHRRCKKFFRPGTSATSLSKRMNYMNEATEILDARKSLSDSKANETELNETVSWEVTTTDRQYTMQTALMMLRQGAFSTVSDSIPYNVYTKNTPTALSEAVLDEPARLSGEYLLLRFCLQEGLFGISTEDTETAKKNLNGPVNRNCCKADHELHEKKNTQLEQEKKKMDGLYSEYNTCQAIVSPKGQKSKVMKALTMPNAMVGVLGLSLLYGDQDLVKKHLPKIQNKDLEGLKVWLNQKGLIKLKQTHFPSEITASCTSVATENAGVACKTVATSGDEYLRQTEKKCIKQTLAKLPNVKVLQISEEKYSFTPNAFKAATRSQRVKTSQTSISHLKTGPEMLNEKTFTKAAIETTPQGKRIISTYLAKNCHRISIKTPIKIIIDSELHLSPCTCNMQPFTCYRYATPIQCEFDRSGFTGSKTLDHIKQKKGEAEMAITDWLYTLAEDMNDGESVVCVVTSGDIDTVVILLFAIATNWPRYDNGKFRKDVYVQLLK